MSFEMMKQIAEVRDQIKALEERIAALEGKPSESAPKRGPGRPPNAEKAK